MVAPVPAHISKLPPRLPAAALRRPLSSYPPLTTYRPLPPLRPLFTQSFEGCSDLSDLCVALFPVFGCSMPTLAFASVCRLFAVSLRSFPHSFPLFSTACSLFSQNTRVGGTLWTPAILVSLLRTLRLSDFQTCRRSDVQTPSCNYL